MEKHTWLSASCQVLGIRKSESFRSKIPELDKQIEHAKRMNEYDPWRYGTQQLRLQAERRACAERLIDLERSRPVDERSGWSPSSGAFWSGSNH